MNDELQRLKDYLLTVSAQLHLIGLLVQSGQKELALQKLNEIQPLKAIGEGGYGLQRN